MQTKAGKSPRLASAGLARGGCIAAAGLFLATPIAHAELRPSLNMNGVTGLIDMPSGEAQPDGQLSVTSSHFGPISRTTLSFQIAPRLSGSFRYMGVRNWNKLSYCQPDCFTGIGWTSTRYDRSFDLRFKALDETRYLPAVTIGLQDFVGTGKLSGEYVVATKTFGSNLKVTAGLGWGRLGSHGGIGSPFGTRAPVEFGEGGDFSGKDWFRGPVAPFGGVEWKLHDDWTLKAEYSSDAYSEEAADRGTFTRKNAFNFGVEYQPSDLYRVGAYYMYGSELGIAGQFFINPKKRPTGGIVDRAPNPVKPRPNQRTDPDAYSGEWITQADAAPILRGNVAKRLEKDGIVVESIGYFTASTVQVRIFNTRYNNNAQAIGRTARALSQTMPASVERFEIVPVVNGIPASKVTVLRSDLERLEFSPEATAQMAQRVDVSGDAGPNERFAKDPEIYPKLSWSLAPYLATSFFDPLSPVRADARLRFSARYEIVPGLVLDGAVSQRLFGNLAQTKRVSDSVLQHVRSDSIEYAREGETALENLTASLYSRPGANLYSRVTVGYLETMFGGVSGELLWKRADSPLALGVEVNYVKQREYAQGFGFQDYSVLTGHVSAYYQFRNGYNAQLDVGRYLAGDVGATLSLEREFANGIVVGVFGTKTDVSAEDFGEGSFDKGIKVTIPVSWGLGTPSRSKMSTTIRPIVRDGGARLYVKERLYEGVKGYHSDTLDAQFGGFWK